MGCAVMSVQRDGHLCYTIGMDGSGRSHEHGGRGVCVGASAWLRRGAARGMRWGIVPLVAVPLLLAGCGKDAGETGVKVIITPAPPTPTNAARSLTPPPTL